MFVLLTKQRLRFSNNTSREEELLNASFPLNDMPK